MKTLLPSPPDSIKPNGPDFIDPLKSLFFRYFEPLVDDCFTRIDLEFGLHLGKDREKLHRELYQNIIAYLRSERVDIQRNYLDALNADFDRIRRHKEKRFSGNNPLGTVSLASDDIVKESYTTTLIIRQCQRKYHEELKRLNQLLALLLERSTFPLSQNPAAPENLLNILSGVVKPLKLSASHRIALYKTFDANVFDQMGFIYRELINDCESRLQSRTASPDYADAGASPLEDPVEPVSVEFQQLQAKLAAWRRRHMPSAYDPVDHADADCYATFEIKNALRILGQYARCGLDEAEPAGLPLKTQVIPKLNALNFSDRPRILASTDEDVLDLVSLFFAEIARHRNLSGPIKSALGQLLIPMSAACLGQYSVFTEPTHPIRKVLDTLVEEGLFLNSITPADRTAQQQLAGFIEKLCRDKGFDTSCWTEAANEITLWLQSRREVCRGLEERLVQTVTEQDKSSSSQQTMLCLIENTINNRALPATITNFLKNTWKDAMLYAYSVKDLQPELWVNSVNTMSTLIASVIPPKDDTERKRILKFIPGMIRELRRGLSNIACDKEYQSRFFKELAVLHVILLDNKAVKHSHTARRTDSSGAAHQDG